MCTKEECVLVFPSGAFTSWPSTAFSTHCRINRMMVQFAVLWGCGKSKIGGICFLDTTQSTLSLFVDIGSCLFDWTIVLKEFWGLN